MHELEYDRIIYQIKSLNAEISILEEKESNGRVDLNYRLSEAYKLVEKSQREKFSNNFFPNAVSNDNPQNASLKSTENKDKEIIAKSAVKQRKSGWQKTIFKAVSKKTHPDVLVNFRKEDKDFYSDVYIKCKQYFNNKKDADLLVIANEVRVKPKKITEDHRSTLVHAVLEKTKKVGSLKNHSHVVWDGLTEDQKKIFLEKQN